MSKVLNFFDYLKAAFRAKLTIPLLGGMNLNYMFLALVSVLGFINQGFWFLGGAAEIFYLYMLATNPRFHNYVKAMERNKLSENFQEKIITSLKSISPAAQSIYREFERQCETILKEQDYDSLINISDDLNTLKLMFLRMLEMEDRMRNILTHSDTKGIETSIKVLESKLQKEKADSVKKSIESSLKIQNDRLSNIEKFQNNLTLASTELDRIKMQVRLIYEERQLNRSPEYLSERINGVVQSINDTSKIVSENSNLMESIELTTDMVQLKN